MWQRFTEGTRRVVFFAQEETSKRGGRYVGTEHVLLAILRESESTAARALNRLGLECGSMYNALSNELPPTPDEEKGIADMQLTSRAKRVLDLAYDEARNLNHEHIGTEHVLLGLIRENEALAGRFLKRSGVGLDEVRELVRQSAIDAETDAIAEEPSQTPSTSERTTAVVGDLGVLRDGDRAVVEVCSDREARELLNATFTARDDHGYRELFATGRFFLVPTDTTAKLLEVTTTESDGTEAARVRILSGAQESEAGWIHLSHWTRTASDAGRVFPPAVDAADFVRVFG